MPTLIVARTDANSAQLLTSDVDERDRPFLTGERTPEGFFRFTGGLDAAIARGLAYAPYADLLWCETSEPNLFEAKRFADAIHARFPGKLLAYNCSPSFNWEKKLDPGTIARFQKELAAMGYKFQFVTLAGFHALNHSMFELARAYRDEGMTAYSRLQQAEFAKREARLLGDAPSARGRHRLLRRRGQRHRRGRELDDGAGRSRPRARSSRTAEYVAGRWIPAACWFAEGRWISSASVKRVPGGRWNPPPL